MSKRKKILLYFGFFYVVFATAMYFCLRFNLINKFSEDKLDQIVLGKSSYRDTTNDLCKYQVLGDPREKGNYVKIIISCSNGKKAISTLKLSAIADKSVNGFLKEYARIIGFDEKLFLKNNIICYLDMKEITDVLRDTIIRPTSTIECTVN